MEKKKREVVILDVDGVLNSYSNRRFYMKFIVRSLRELSKVHGRKKLFKELVGIKKYGGAKGFFVFAKKILAFFPALWYNSWENKIFAYIYS